jgi:hypothetical protein
MFGLVGVDVLPEVVAEVGWGEPVSLDLLIWWEWGTVL